MRMRRSYIEELEGTCTHVHASVVSLRVCECERVNQVVSVMSKRTLEVSPCLVYGSAQEGMFP